MKKVILTLAFFTSMCFTSMQAQTTLDEYRFITKGLKKQLAEGLDPQKKGYIFELIEKMEYEEKGHMNGFSFMRMIHEKDGLKAIIMSFYQAEEIHTFCIPHPNTAEAAWLTSIQDFNTFWQARDNFPYLSSAFMKMLYFYESAFEDSSLKDSNAKGN